MVHGLGSPTLKADLALVILLRDSYRIYHPPISKDTTECSVKTFLQSTILSISNLEQICISAHLKNLFITLKVAFFGTSVSFLSGSII